jgi:DNA uptake protein ComE-like DNA-binding protein
MLPAREPPGMEQFRKEAAAFFVAMEDADSLEQMASLQINRARYLTAPHADSGTQKKRVPYRISSVDLNTADSLALLPLPGIGPVFAGRIVKYRNLLGGFVSPEQLMEVYGMEGETLQRIGPYIYIDSARVKKIDINTAGFRTLLRHPYLEFNDVKSLVNYRDIQGHIGSASEIWEHGILGDSTLKRIAPYLLFSL